MSEIFSYFGQTRWQKSWRYGVINGVFFGVIKKEHIGKENKTVEYKLLPKKSYFYQYLN